MEDQRSSDGDLDTEYTGNGDIPRRVKNLSRAKTEIMHSMAIKRREDKNRYQLNKGEKYIVSMAPPMSHGPYTKESMSKMALWYLQHDIPWSKTEHQDDVTARRSFAAKVKHYAARHNLTEKSKDDMDTMSMNDFKAIVKERDHRSLQFNIGVRDGTGDLEPYMGDDEKGLLTTKSITSLRGELKNLHL